MSRMLLALFLATTVMAGTASMGAAQELRFASSGDAVSMDPYIRNEVFTYSFLGNVYEGLVRRNPDLTIAPELAESWEMVSPTQWRFHLRQGVSFHDGSPFTADDVIFSADRVRAGDSDFKNRLSGVTEVVKVDDYTVDFITAEPNPILHFTWPNWYIMSKTWAEANGVADASRATDVENFATLHANGTGPFKLVTREPGIKTTLEANDGWWNEANKAGNVESVTYTPLPNDATRVAALLSGQMDMVYPIPVQDIPRLEAAPNVKVIAGPEVRTMYLTMNQWKDTLPGSAVEGENPFKDQRVREAVYRAIDIDLINQRIMRGQATAAALMVAPGVNGFTDQIERYAYDPEKSKALLAEAGYPDGFKLTFQCSNDMYLNDEAICLAISSMLARVGIEADTNVQARAQYLEAVLSPNMDFGLAMLGTTPASLDSHIALFSLHMCPRLSEDRPIWAADDIKSLVAGTSNYAGYCNPEVDALSKQILSETDEAKRDELIKQAWTITTDDVAYIPLMQSWSAWATAANVTLERRADNVFDWRYVTID
ncbi:ABC transporter substrate-binding protein [Devosia sp. 63-57]|uniref:ABC transporter substrate-binding protein n=1 Tax=Devosia sp. 63-57 TaxID=1895751 RepID=UPI000868F8CF|nr:ABC transporter substrate-binding protein [Devosia sp. 63-57]ODT47724.1 MAG: ABC transporter substrate-binding protein [Pelagibacterium sp. SCN 63-126]ODU88220.1 MAG: ABC transporter substrate-binding protein [Pelagibacterium sp. SCN 63-17]OJX42568.1 MAG: ABC transporter substrate-binding protein [Devosia sp. 63-57]